MNCEAKVAYNVLVKFPYLNTYHMIMCLETFVCFLKTVVLCKFGQTSTLFVPFSLKSYIVVLVCSLSWVRVGFVIDFQGK